jgi:poly(hydroxyalkanoate) depolymerase family esterase
LPLALVLCIAASVLGRPRSPAPAPFALGSRGFGVPRRERYGMRNALSRLAKLRKPKNDSERATKKPMPHRLFLPADLRRDVPVPLLVALHGCLQSPADFAAGTRFDELGARYGAIVVYPEQSKRANPSGCWNWFQTKHQTRKGGEPARILRLVNALVHQYPVDRERIYVAGISAGGSMAAILAEQAPDVFAGVAVMAGVALHSSDNLLTALAAMAGLRTAVETAPPFPPEAYRRMRVTIWTGANDSTVAPSNAATLAGQFARLLGLGAAQQEREPARDGILEASSLRDATGRVRVRLVTVADMDHAWSGGSPQGSFTYPEGPDASTAIFEFFAGAV